MKKLILLAQELLGYIASGKVGEDILEKFVSQFREKIEKVAEPVAGEIKKVTKFLRTVTYDLPERDLVKFFKDRKGLYASDGDFQEILTDAVSDGKMAPAEKVTMHWHTNTEDAHDDIIYPEIGEDIIELSTAEGRKMARTRLNILATNIEKQEGGKEGDFRNDGYVNFVGKFRTIAKRVLLCRGRWYSDDREWRCSGWRPRERNADSQFLSRNGETK